MRKFGIAISLSVQLFCLAAASEPQFKEAARPILEHAEKPFPDFAKSVQSATLPELPDPGKEGNSPILSEVREILWKRISGFDAVITSENKARKIDEILALCGIRSWLLRHRAYSNLLMVSHIDETLSLMLLRSLEQKILEPAEATRMLQALVPVVSASDLLGVAKACAPASATLAEFDASVSANATDSLIELAQRVSEERRELIDTRLHVLRSSLHVASFIAYVCQGEATATMTRELMKYASRGGGLGDSYENFAIGFRKLSPESIQLRDPTSLVKLSLPMYFAILENAREIKGRH